MSGLYHINLGTPVRDMGGFSFEILLWPEWKEAVARRGLTQREANKLVENMHRRWLDACGYDQTCGFGDKPERPLYDQHCIHILWGEWGPEHISVPGNGCGLDIDHGLHRPKDGMALAPHNVDCMRQAFLLLLIFNWFAHDLFLNEQNLEYARSVK